MTSKKPKPPLINPLTGQPVIRADEVEPLAAILAERKGRKEAERCGEQKEGEGENIADKGSPE